MNRLMSFLLLFLTYSAVFHLTKAQTYDFDSLYKNDKNFKSQFKAIDDSRDIFSSDQLMKITIESDFKYLVKNKEDDEEQPAVFKYYYHDTIVVTRDIFISPRGNMRKSNCFFPPLKLNFQKDEVKVKEMKEFDKMKKVRDCRGGKIYEQYLLSEYTIYKILNTLTDYSFRVRLMQVTYVDTSEKFKTTTKYAFIIENKEQMAERLKAVPIDTKDIRDTKTDIPTLVNAYLFQYLIGNTDWSIPGRHNIQMIQSVDASNSTPYVIPYDFDYAGMINTVYAVPDPQLGIESVRERVYRGVCIPEADLKAGVGRFLDHKTEIYALYEDSDLLDKSNKRNSINYLDSFYDVIENDRSFKRNILDACR